MDIKKLLKNMSKPIEKYKYMILILVIGLVLMLLPTTTNSTHESTYETPQEQSIPLNEQIAALLSKVEGAGRVEVMLSIETGEEILYQCDEDLNTGEQANSIRKETVIVSDYQRNEAGLVKQTNPPNYLGAIIVCEGADSPKVRLDLMDAISKITGLRSDCIAILKMK